MPRRRRIIVPGLAHHVTQRGNYRQIVFHHDKDFRKYSYLMRQYAQEYQVDILAYCLMRNHVHFIVIPPKEDSLARLFNCVHMLYSQYKNEQDGQKGHLWQGRFYSCVLSEDHLFHAVRYVEQNPSRANLVKTPSDYIWSSARKHLGLETDSIIKTRNSMKILKILGQESDWREYLQQNDETTIQEIRKNTKKGFILGSDEFIKSLEHKLGYSLRHKKPGRPKKLGTAPYFF